MNKPFVKTRKFVNENKTYLAFCAGSILTSTTIIALTRNVDLLKLTKDHQELLRLGGAIKYELRGQTLHLVNIPAAEAALNVTT